MLIFRNLIGAMAVPAMIDAVEHNLVPDTRSLREFDTTGLLAPGGERSFIMNSLGTTTFHCTIHPQMAGTLIVQNR
jgi:plastocyanin